STRRRRSRRARAERRPSSWAASFSGARIACRWSRAPSPRVARRQTEPSRLRPCDHEHEAAVGDVAAVQLNRLGSGEQPRDHAFWILPVVHDRPVNPAAAIVRPEDLRLAAPVGGVIPVGGRPVASGFTGEYRSDLAIGAFPNGRLIPEEDQRFAGAGITKAAAQRLVAFGGLV